MKSKPVFPAKVPNWVNAKQIFPNEFFEKRDPHNNEVICEVGRSKPDEVSLAVEVALEAQKAWGELSPVTRGDYLFEICLGLKAKKLEMAELVALETGKSLKEALGETEAAIALGLFMAGEGRRFFGRTTSSASPTKFPQVIREPLGVAGLIVAANTPIANVAWKVFPALVGGNAVVLKAAEDTPLTAWKFGQITHSVIGFPAGVLNIINGFGKEAGAPLVENKNVSIVSFTGSSAVGEEIGAVTGRRLAKVSLELGGKNPLIVCDDANLENAVKWTVLSAFSNAGQRCASASRIIVDEKIYDEFKTLLIRETEKLCLGNKDGDDLGPVINQRQLDRMLTVIGGAKKNGATVLTGGKRSSEEHLKNGYYMEPTIIEGVSNADEISTVELFGPVTCLYKVSGFDKALAMANDSPYGLTAAIHTKNIHRATHFSRRVKAGVVVLNAGTYGSEPHMPFGGVKRSGNGTREPGPEALDVYTNTKVIYNNLETKEI